MDENEFTLLDSLIGIRSLLTHPVLILLGGEGGAQKGQIHRVRQKQRL